MPARRQVLSKIPRVLATIMVLAATVAGAAAMRSGGPSEPQTAREDRLVIFAAASLREGFTAIGTVFKRDHPGVEVVFHFAGTQELRTQLVHGAVADVVASADQHHMDELVLASEVQSPLLFARNEPVVVVSVEGSRVVRRFEDLPAAERIVLGAQAVPIGRYTQEILERCTAVLGPEFRPRVEAKVVSREINVRQVLAKVGLEEAQAGIVYRSDTHAGYDKVAVVAIPAEINVIAQYPIAVTRRAASPRLARAWVELVLSPSGQKALAAVGFLPVRGIAL